MEVKLVSLTKSLVEEADLTPEELIVYIARVSNPENQLNKESSDKLLKYLIANKHWSPFAMCDMTVSIKTSRAIAAQILRHKSFDFQEFSQRYGIVNEFEPVELRKQAGKNRQGTDGGEFNPEMCADSDGSPMYYNTDGSPSHASDRIQAYILEGEYLYNELLKKGIGKEVARMILPLTTTTKIYMKGSIRSWIHYLEIRTEEHTQKEHQDVALEIEKIFKQHFPNVAKALGI